MSRINGSRRIASGPANDVWGIIQTKDGIIAVNIPHSVLKSIAQTILNNMTFESMRSDLLESKSAGVLCFLKTYDGKILMHVVKNTLQEIYDEIYESKDRFKKLTEKYNATFYFQNVVDGHIIDMIDLTSRREMDSYLVF